MSWTHCDRIDESLLYNCSLIFECHSLTRLQGARRFVLDANRFLDLVSSSLSQVLNISYRRLMRCRSSLEGICPKIYRYSKLVRDLVSLQRL